MKVVVVIIYKRKDAELEIYRCMEEEGKGDGGGGNL